jgi:hypothetical protein
VLCLKLADAHTRGDRLFVLVFDVDGGVRRASVCVHRQARDKFSVEFPHVVDEDGLSLGSNQADAVIRDRCQDVLLYLDAACAWAMFRRAG